MSRFEVVKEIASNQNYELLENHLHEDFMLIREEGLVMRDEYLEYVKSHFEEDSNELITVLDLKVKYEDDESLIWQDLFDTSDGKRMITTTYEAYKDDKCWRQMMTKKEVNKDVVKL